MPAAQDNLVARPVLVGLVTVAAFIDLVAYSVAVPVLPDMSRRLGASPTMIGLLFASFGATLLLVSVPMGAISDRVGRKIPLVAGLVALAASTLLFAVAERMSWLFVARMIQGAADAVTWVVGFALVADMYGPAERGRVMGLVMAGTSFGLMIGPTFGGWLYESGGALLPFAAVAVAALVVAAIFLVIRFPEAKVAAEAVPVLQIARTRAVVTCVLLVIVAASTIAMLEPVLSLWLAADLGLGPARVGVVFGAAAVGSTLLHPVYGGLADRWGAQRMTIIGLVMTASLLPIVSTARSFETAVALYVLEAAAIALVVTPSLAYMAEVVSSVGAGSFGVAYGLYNFAWGAGLLAGPALGGFLFERLGFAGLTVAWVPIVVGIAFWLAKADRLQVPERAG
jgi:multidrug resistance protein